MAGNWGPDARPRRWPSLFSVLGLLGTYGCNMSSGGGGGRVGNPPPGGAISIAITSPANPNNVNVQADIGTQNFTAAVSNDSANGGVSWKLTLNGSASSCNQNACGSLSNSTSSSGVAIIYTAPSTPPAGPVTLIAASVTDSTKTANATITVTPAVALQSSPSNANPVNLQADLGSQQFSVTVNNDAHNAGVNWTYGGTGCNGSACGTLSSTTSLSGNPITYMAPSRAPSPATVTLTATSVTDPNQKLSWTINIMPAVSVVITTPANANSVNVQADIGTQNFTATVNNDGVNAGVTWKLDGAGCSGVACGTLTNPTASANNFGITYAAPASPPSPATVTLTATSVTDKNQLAPATITVTPAVAVSASASSPAIPISLTANLTATVSNDAQNKGVNWVMTIGGNACTVPVCGVLNSNSSLSGAPVKYTAPTSVPTPATITFTATSVADPNKSNPATITITLPISVSVASVSTPPRTNYPLQVSQMQAFAATVQNDPNGQGVAWTLSSPSITGCNSNPTPPACGALSSITSTGISYTAPSTVSVPNPTVFTLTATSVADPTQSASETIPVSQGIPTTFGWFEIPNTNIQPTCPTDPAIQGADGCKGVISAWSGGAADTKRNRLLFAGGGHENYWGNEVFALDLNQASPAYLTVDDINPATSPPPPVLCTEDWGNPPNVPSAPAPRETYGDLAYAANVDKLWLFGGAPATTFEPCRSNGMWVFDIAGLSWQQLNQTLTISSPPAGQVGNITLATAATPGMCNGSPCPWLNGPTLTDINYSDYDPGSGLIYSYLADQDILTSYDPTTNKLTSLQAGQFNGTNFRANGVLDPVRHIFLIVGQGTLAWFDLNTTPPTFQNPYNAAQTSSSPVFACLNLQDPTAVANAISPGLAYDSVADRVVGWAGGNNIYVIDTTQAVSTGTLTCHVLTSFTGGPPVEQPNGTFGRFRYFPALDLFALVNDWQQNAFTFRPSNPLP